MFLHLLAQIDPQAIIDGASDSAQSVSNSFGDVTELVLNSPLYMAIARIGSGFAAVLVAIWVVMWGKSAAQNDAAPPLENLMVPIVLVVLLSNGAALLSEFSLSARHLINETNQFVLEYTANGVDLAQAYASVSRNQGMEMALGEMMRQCADGGSPEEQTQCLEELRIRIRAMPGFEPPPDAEERILQAQMLVEEGGGNWAEQIAAGTLANVGNIIGIFVQHLLSAMSMAFQWMVELVMLLVFLSGPLAIGASLLPAGAKPVFAWLGGICGAAMTKLSFNIMVGLAAMVALQAPANDPMVFLLVIGILAPLLATVISSFGGASIYGALAGIASNVFGMAVGGAGAAAGNMNNFQKSGRLYGSRSSIYHVFE